MVNTEYGMDIYYVIRMLIMLMIYLVKHSELRSCVDVFDIIMFM